MIITYHIEKTFGWIRLFGRGISWKNEYEIALSFTEWYGYKKYWRLGKWIVTYLHKPKK